VSLLAFPAGLAIEVDGTGHEAWSDDT
jgi:hypothetical protein